MADKLDLIFDDQAAFEHYVKDFKQMFSVADTKELILCMHSELDEVLGELNWKKHRIEDKNIITSNVYEELIDILKYWLVLAQIWGLGPEKIVEEYFRKSLVVRQKWGQEHSPSLSTDKIVCVDIDGVLCNYPATWLRFIKTNFPGKLILEDSSKITSLDLSRTLKNPSEYKNLKNLFRESGVKREAIVNVGAKEFLISLSKKFKIVLVSARPVQIYRRIYADTIEWLRNNELYFDFLVFEEDKRSWALTHKTQIEFCVEDDSEQAIRLATYGLRVYLLDCPYNRDVKDVENLTRIYSLGEISG